MTVSVLHFAEDGDTSGFFPQLARWHDRSRFRMHFGTLKGTDPNLAAHMADLGIPCFSGGAEDRSGYPLAALRFASYLRRNHVDIVHTHLFDPSVVGLLTSLLARTPLRLMTRHHSDYHTRIHKPGHVALDRLCTRLSHVVIAISRHTRDHMVSLEAAPPAKIRVVHNGIDFDRVRRPDPEAGARVRAEVQALDTDLLVVPARLHPEKGHPHLFRALALARRRLRRPVVALLAGAGTFESEYRRQVTELGIEDMVRFLGFRRDICDLMVAADLVVLPSVAEAFGLVLAEALYLGTPVLTTRVGGIPEIVDDGVDGVLVAAGDACALAGALVALLNDPDARLRLARQGSQKIQERFSFERMVRGYEAVYDELPRQARTEAPGR
jgi:glycosyltransferase involved in cell wall biosynthesis